MQSRRSRRFLAVAVSLLLLAGVGGAVAEAPYRSTLPEGSPEAPLLHGEVLPGRLAVRISPVTTAVSAKAIDGDPSDWAGVPANYGGQTTISRGELIYTDHIFDSFGADNGVDKERTDVLDPLNEAVPETYRLESIYQANLPDEFGLPAPEQLVASDHYGDLPRVDEADIAEVRVGATSTDLQLLVRTTTMTAAKQPGVLVLVDVDGAQASSRRPVPLGGGLWSSAADLAVLLAPDGSSRVVDMATGAVSALSSVAFRVDGWDNAVEASLPLSLVGSEPRIAVAAGAFDAHAASLANVANVAFRHDEPVRGMYWDKQQAYMLAAGTVDPFFFGVPTGGLARGIDGLVDLEPGYYDRIFRSTDQVSREGGEDGILQHYGVYVPTSYKQGTSGPATFWMHWRGGKAHSAAALAPRIFRDYGESRGNLVVSPRGRGTSTWYEGKGHVDVLQVWNDVVSTYSVDLNRVYLTGHSMGGWASYFLASVYPDRFAATMPVEGAVTQGAYISPEENCGEPCYLETNEGDAVALHSYKILDNLRNTPIAIYQGLIDELVPETGTLLQVRKLQDLGYRYRFYQFIQYEHYTHPVMDEWAAGARWMDRFTRDPNPPRVTYKRDMPFERAVELGPNVGSRVPGLDFNFDSAYWMSGLTPVDSVAGVAQFDGVTFGRPAAGHVAAPDSDVPASVGQTGPYVIVGQQWLTLPTATVPAWRNAFEVTLTGASAVTLDALRMGLDLSQPVEAKITTDSPLTLRLVSPDGERQIVVAPGTSTVTL